MQDTSVKQELLELENRYWQALKDRDVDTAMSLTDGTCIVTGSQGVHAIDRQTLAGMMNEERYALEDFKVSNDVQVRMLDDDVAVIAYQVHEELTVDGEPVSLDAADASTWVRRNGKWVCALHTESINGDPFGRDRAASVPIESRGDGHARRGNGRPHREAAPRAKKPAARRKPRRA
jgi:hypothetical protein